jgi:hypothetical protein
MREMISGGVALGYAVAGLFFLKFWRRTKDQLFLSFAIAFWILGATRVGLVIMNERNERYEGVPFYVLRLIAFLLIIGAVWHKNATSKARSDQA